MLTRTTHLLATGLLCLSFVLPAFAQLPSRGMSMDKVVHQYGDPREKTRPVGDPPITRWVYDDFTVYFEGRYALHAVKHRSASGTSTSSGDQPEEREQPQAPAQEPSAPAQPQFRFDPATGRVIEVGPNGEALDAPTASPGSAPTAPADQDDAPAFDPATGQFRGSSDSEAETGKVERPARPEPIEQEPPAPNTDSGPAFNPMTGQFESSGEAPAQSQPSKPEPEPEPAPEPRKRPDVRPPAEKKAAEPETSSPLRFNPTTGEFEPVEEAQPANETGAPAEQSAPERKAKPKAAEPEAVAPPKAETPEEAPEAEADKSTEGSEPRFRFDPTTGRIIMDDTPPPTAN